MNEIDLLNTHSLKKLRRLYLYDRTRNVIGWIALIGIIAAGCYWVVSL